jgi:hypothetical protein
VTCRFRVSGFGFRVVCACGLIALLLASLQKLVFAQAIAPAENPKLQTRNSQPLFWADGIMRLDELRSYQRAGFNTVVVHITWPPSPDGQIVAADIAPQREFAAAAAKLGLNIIYALPPAPFGQENKFHVSGEAGPYRMLWSNWVQNAISGLRKTPNLIGWMLPDDPRSLPFATNAGFSHWIEANYGSVQVLNRQWSAAFASLDEVTIGATRQIIAAWRGPGALPTQATDAQMREYIARAQRRPANQNFAFHPAALALAHYQWDAYRALLDFWAKTVRAADPQRQIFSGRLPDYAQLLSLPGSVDVSQPAISPAWAEKDFGAHHPQAVSVARRGGRFGVVSMLSTQLPGAPDDLVPRLVPSWCDAALAEGARGVAFDSWPALAQNAQLRRAVHSSLLRLQSPEYSLLWGQVPQSTTAVLLTPLADGYTWHPPSEGTAPLPPLGAPAEPSVPPRGLFGFGEDMVSGEPSDLVYSLRWGTLFGSVDFLSPDELGGSYSLTTGGALKRYSVVLMPQALSIPPAMAQELANYVGGGGTIVADLGVGAWENGGQVLGFPESLAAIFGIIPTQLQALSFNLQATMPYPLLPTWSALAAANPQAITHGDGPQGAAFAGPTLFAEIAPGTVPLALAFQMPQQLGRADANRGNAAHLRLLRSWLTLRPFGQGNAIFAPFRMWTLWHPGYAGFDQFHGDLMARGAQISHLNTRSLVPAPAGVPDGAALYPEAVNFPDAVALINHNAAPNPPYAGDASTSAIAPDDVAGQIKALNAALAASPSQAAIVQTAGVEQFLWSNALCLFPVGAAPAPTLGRHPPVSDFGAISGDAGFVVPPTAHPVILHTFVPAQEMRVLRLLPIRALNPGGGPIGCRVREYSPQRIELRVWPNAQSAAPNKDNSDWLVTLGVEGLARVTIFDSTDEGAFRILPDTRYRVAVTQVTSDGSKNTTATNTYILNSTGDATLGFEIKGNSLRVEVWPLETVTPDAEPGASTPVAAPAIVPDSAPAIVPDAPNTPEKPDVKTPAPGNSSPPENPGDAADGVLFHKRFSPRSHSPNGT